MTDLKPALDKAVSEKKLLESSAKNITQLLARLLLKGTKTRSAERIATEIESVGGHMDSYGGNNSFGVNAEVLSGDFAHGLDLVSDVLLRPSFPAEAVERERGVILREMEEVEKEAEEVLFDHLHATAYQFTSLGRTILGSADNVRRLSRDDLVAYIRTHYTAPRMVLVGAGAVGLVYGAHVAEGGADVVLASRVLETWLPLGLGQIGRAHV